MEIQTIKYHQNIAEYFASKPLYLDEPSRKKPNIRKLVELPYQQTKSLSWVMLEALLTDFYFIETKVKANLAFDMLRDYARTELIWPESPISKRRIMVIDYVRKLNKYSKAFNSNGNDINLVIPIFPSPPKSIEIFIDNKLEIDKNNWSPYERIKSFRNFVANNLKSIVSSEESIFQTAYNSADVGPVVQKAQLKLFSENENNRPWIRLLNRPKFFLDPVCLMMLVGHSYWVTSVAITADGHLVVSGSRDCSVRLWNIETGECQIFNGNESDVNSVSITPDGRYIVSGGMDSTVRVWDVETGESQIFIGHVGAVNSVSITPDGQLVVSGGVDKSIRIWNIISKMNRILIGHKGSISSLCITADGNKVISGGGDEDQIVRLWDLNTGTSIELIDHEGPVNTVSITPDGKYAASCGENNMIYLWDLITRNRITLSSHSESVSFIAITHDGRMVLSASRDRTIRVWNVKTGENRIINNKHICPILAIAITPDGKYAISGSGGIYGTRLNPGINENAIGVWDIEAEEHSTPKDPVKVRKAMFTPNGNYAIWDYYSDSQQMSLQILNLKTYESKILEGFSLNNILPDSENIVLDNCNKELFILNLITNQSKIIMEDIDKFVHITPDGKRAISVNNNYDENNNLLFLDMKTMKSSVFEKSKGWIQDYVLSFDGRKVISVRGDHTLSVWDLLTSKNYFFKDQTNDDFGSIVLTPDGKCAITCSRGIFHCPDTTLSIWNLKNGLRNIINGERILKIDISPDGRRIVSCAKYSHVLSIWQIDTNRCYPIEIHEDGNGINSVSFLPDGNRVISTGKDKKLCIWDVEDKKSILSLTSAYSSINVLDQHFPFIIASNENNQLSILKIENFSLKLPPLVTGIRLWLWGEQIGTGEWDLNITTVCFWCAKRFQVPTTILKTITNISKNARLKYDESPCLNLSSETWKEAKLLSKCPNCGGLLRFNPFIIDVSESKNLIKFFFNNKWNKVINTWLRNCAK